MARYALTDHFRAFFTHINPTATFESQAADAYSGIKTLLEDPNGLARELSPRCFLQGSYRQETAIHSINDIDIVALCNLTYTPAPVPGFPFWNRDQIFATVAAPLLRDGRYYGKVQYGASSTCIKVDLGVKAEILPAIFRPGNNDPSSEPFRFFKPEVMNWVDGYARLHQDWLTWKNGRTKTFGNFKPAIKVLKHLRSIYSVETVSFHIECFLFRLPDSLFQGGPADYIPAVLAHIAATPATTWYGYQVLTPCGERDIFQPAEWKLDSWQGFHAAVSTWYQRAEAARRALLEGDAIRSLQSLLGREYFPRAVTA